MSWTLLERARGLHEDIERYERGIMGILNDKTKTNKDRVWQQHHVKNCIGRINECANDLKKFYLDEDRIFREENETMQGRNVMSSFYENLKEIKEHHTRFPNTIVNHEPPIELEKEVQVQFSGEEVFGKYFDLHLFHEQFNNLGHFERVEYGVFLNQIINLSRLPESKKNLTYYKFVSELCNYFEDFFRRTQPLIEFNELIKECLGEFEDKWDKNGIEGWTNPNHSILNSFRPLNLDQFNSQQELEALGAERLKEALSAIGLKCGGTTKERAERLYSIKGLSAHEIPQKLKVVENKKRLRSELEEERKKKMAEAECRIVYWVGHMQDIYQNTIRLIDKKLTRTVEEREAEIKEEEEGALPDLDDEEEEESDNEVIYNPLNLPLGWDGKPIPFWLYKLYGLGVEYKCEICGNYSYWGRRAFDRHFQEWRHAYGMRRLGIPNTKHFHDITVIDDALTLYAKIKDEINAEIYHPEQEEEYEDAHGNIMSRSYANGSYSY